jgi:hypothetical protein
MLNAVRMVKLAHPGDQYPVMMDAYISIPFQRFPMRMFSFSACWLLSWFAMGTVTGPFTGLSSKEILTDLFILVFK